MAGKYEDGDIVTLTRDSHTLTATVAVEDAGCGCCDLIQLVGTGFELTELVEDFEWTVTEHIKAVPEPMAVPEKLPQEDGVYLLDDNDDELFPLYIRYEGSWTALFSSGMNTLAQPRTEQRMLQGINGAKLIKLVNEN